MLVAHRIDGVRKVEKKRMEKLISRGTRCWRRRRRRRRGNKSLEMS